jgi:N-methylhydantoinase A
MTTLIGIDNGGTLTDAIAVRDGKFYRAKALTTPHDLSKCFIESLAALSREVYGEEALDRLLGETEIIRYSTTQGTNALVQARDKGPRLGLVVESREDAAGLARTAREADMFATIVGDRIADVCSATDIDGDVVVGAINQLLAKGANRIVVALSQGDYVDREAQFRTLLLRKFPRHYLGAVPVLLAHELTVDGDFRHRAWSGLLNSFLHPTMEHFLYNAENELRQHNMRRPLMVFRNDGNSSRVAKTVALKTYSSGPRGGMEGARAYAGAYGAARAVCFDVGGTTTDIGVVSAKSVGEMDRGQVEGIATSFPMCDVLSVGIGGSSVLAFADGAYRIGPESVGASPGPACFGRGGDRPTITDVYLLLGYLDPDSYFAGRLKLVAANSEKAIDTHVATLAEVDRIEALLALDDAYHRRMAAAILQHAAVDGDTLLLAFGGAGPMSACKVAELAGIDRVVVPHAASVFCAYGLGFSDVRYAFEEAVTDDSEAVLARLLSRARREMFAEGFDADECAVVQKLLWTDGEESFTGEVPALDGRASARLRIEITRTLEHFPLRDVAATPGQAAAPHGMRHILDADGVRRDQPFYRIEEMEPGMAGTGPAVLEDAYATLRVPQGWTFLVNGNLDIVLERK